MRTLVRRLTPLLTALGLSFATLAAAVAGAAWLLLRRRAVTA